MFLHNFAFDDPEVFLSKPKIEVKVKVKSVKEKIMFETKCNSEDRKMQSCYGGKGARVVNTRRNGILINFPVVRRGECLVSDTRQAVGSRQGGLYTLVFGNYQSQVTKVIM